MREHRSTERFVIIIFIGRRRRRRGSRGRRSGRGGRCRSHSVPVCVSICVFERSTIIMKKMVRRTSVLFLFPDFTRASPHEREFTQREKKNFVLCALCLVSHTQVRVCKLRKRTTFIFHHRERRRRRSPNGRRRRRRRR